MVSDFIEIRPGLVVDTDGVIIEAADRDDAMKFIASKRHDAKQQMEEWKSYVQDLDRVLLKNQSERKLNYDNLVVSIRGGTYSKTDTEAFANECYALTLEPSDLFAIIAAASGFKKDKLPESAKAAFESHTATLEKHPWVESSIARRRAPEIQEERNGL